MLELSIAEYYLLFVIGAALVLIVSNLLPPDLVALMILLALGLSGIVTLEQTLSGFSNPAVITIIGLFIITGALERNGVILWLSGRLSHLAGTVEIRLVTVMMSAGALLSLVINNIAAGAVLLPAALRVAQQAQVRPSRVLLPLAFGTLVGGMATLFTTANILVSAMLQEQGQRPLTMFDFLVSGGVVMLAGLAYMVLIGRRMLPDRESSMRAAVLAEHDEIDLQDTYELEKRLWEAYMPPGSPLVGKTLRESRLGADLGITVLALKREEELKIPLNSRDRINAEDVLLVLGRQERVHQLESMQAQVNPASEQTHALYSEAIRPHEVMIPPRSPVIGCTLTDLQFRSRLGLTAVAIWRGSRSYRTDVGKMPLQAGDALLMIGPDQRLQELGQEPGYIVPDAPRLSPSSPKKLWATLIAALAIGASIVGLIPTPEAMLLGAVTMVLTGCLRMSEVYSVVEWRIIFLIAGMAPLSVAMQETGLADKVGNLFVSMFEPLGPLGLVAGFYLLTFLVVQMLGGQVTALVVGPLAITSALQAGVNPVATGVAVAIACSASFLTPVAHPVNLLMMNPGAYTPGDFLRVGSGMALVCFLATMLSMALFWQL
jgi:di/tricarboxylate transporter